MRGVSHNVIYLSVCQGGSQRASVSGEDRDPFRFRHMISTDALQVRTLTGAGNTL